MACTGHFLIRLQASINKKLVTVPEPPKYQDVFGYSIIELAEANPLIMGITPAMPSGCSAKIHDGKNAGSRIRM